MIDDFGVDLGHVSKGPHKLIGVLPKNSTQSFFEFRRECRSHVLDCFEVSLICFGSKASTGCGLSCISP